VATEQSERIRAALMRAKASQQSSDSPTLKPEEAATTQPPTQDEQTSDVLVEEEEVSADSAQEVEEAEQAEVETEEEPEEEHLHEEVETTLPLIAATEQQRAAILNDEPTPRKKSAFIFETEPELRPSVQVGTEAHPSRVPRMALILVGVLAVAGASVFLLKDRLWPSSGQNGSVSSFPLQMQVEPQGNGIINVRWNPQSSAITSAHDGRLTILEGDQQTRTIPLTEEQLKSGHLYYQTTMERVEFRLEVVSRSGAIAKESVMALSSGAKPEPPAGPPIAPTPDQPSALSSKPQPAPAAQTPAEPARSVKPAETAKAQPSQVQPPQQSQTPPQQSSRVPTRSFAPPPIQKKLQETSAVALPDALPVVTGGTAPVPAPVPVPEAAVRLPAPQVKEPPAPSRTKTGGNLQEPKLIKRITPVYPATAQAANIQGKVRFTATIGKDGTIQNLQPISGPPVLIPAATDAVKKWVYQPMMLNGEPTEVITQIEVNFALRQ